MRLPPHRLTAEGDDNGGGGGGDDAKAKFLESMGTDLAANPAIAKFESPQALGQAYIEAEKKIGTQGLMKPTETATPQEVRGFFGELGCPKSVDEYDITEVKKTEGVPWDEDFEKKMRGVAWQYGIPQPAYRHLVQAFADESGRQYKDVADAWAADTEKCTTELKSEWGPAFEPKKEKAEQAMSVIFGESYDKMRLLGTVDGGVLGNHPDFLKGMAEVGEFLADHDMLEGVSRTTTPTKETAKAELQGLMADSKFVEALTDPKNLGHKNAVEKRRKLYEIVHGDATRLPAAGLGHHVTRTSQVG